MEKEIQILLGCYYGKPHVVDACELVGIIILAHLTKLTNQNNAGLHRDMIRLY